MLTTRVTVVNLTSENVIEKKRKKKLLMYFSPQTGSIS